MNRFNRVKLPTDPEGFERLVQKVCRKFKLPDQRHAAGIISITIRQLPNHQAYTTYSHLGHSVLKNLSNYCCNYVSQSLKHEDEVKQLENLLEQDPNNFQARDKLYEASAQGSQLAKKALEKYEDRIHSAANDVEKCLPN